MTQKKCCKKREAESPRYALPKDHFEGRMQNASGGLPKVSSPGKCCGPVTFLFFKSLFSFCLLLFFFFPFFFPFFSFSPFFSLFFFCFLCLRYTFLANPVRVLSLCVTCCGWCAVGWWVGRLVGWWVSGRKTKNRTFQGCGKISHFRGASAASDEKMPGTSISRSER